MNPNNILFGCPIISNELLTKNQWKPKIKSYLSEKFKDEPISLACAVVLSCNDKEIAEPCIAVLQKYVMNLISNENEEKFKKIKMHNRIFCERVKEVEGAIQFLLAIGFKEWTIDDEPFLVFDKNINESKEELQQSMNQLNDTNLMVKLELSRNTKIFEASTGLPKGSFTPKDFFNISVKELQSEQAARTKEINDSMILSSKRDKVKATNQEFTYSFIRIRFPDGTSVQGTFESVEKVYAIYEWIKNYLEENDTQFILVTPNGKQLLETDFNQSLSEKGFIPNIVLFFHCKSDVKLLKQCSMNE